MNTTLDDKVSGASDERAFREIDVDDVARDGAVSVAWKTSEVIAAGPGAQLPPGLEPVERPFFEHQRRALRELTRWWEGEEGAGVLCLPTGGGKTRTATGFVLRNLGSGFRTLWLAHRVELVTQAIATLAESSGEAVRSFQVGRFDAQAKVRIPADVVVASIPTLARRSGGAMRRLEELMRVQERFDLVVVDECHHGAAKSWARLVETLRERGSRVLGLSATPTRTNEKELGRFWRLFGEVVYEEPLLELIRHRVLSRPRPIAMSTEQTYRASDKERKEFESFGDLPSTLVKRISDDFTRNQKIVAAIREHRDEWGQILVFSGSVQQARKLAGELREVGIPAESVDGTTKPEDRQAAVQRFQRRDLRVMVNVNLFTEGTDLPGVETVIIARPTRSRILFQQMVGRGMRGPRVGGSPYCNIVMFHDEVEGLLEEALASTFTSEREALDALDIDTLESPPVDPRPKPLSERPVPHHDVHALIQYLEDAARAGEEALRGVALTGWWEARTPVEVAFLPVFEGANESAEAWVQRLEAQELAAIPGELRDALPITVLEAFRDAAEHPEAKVRHVALDDGSAAESLLDLARRLKAVDDDAPVPEWWQAVSVAQGSTAQDPVVYGDEEGSFVFDAEALDALQDDLAGIMRRVKKGHSLPEIAQKRYELYAEYGLGPRQFQRLVQGALRAGRVPEVSRPQAPDEKAVAAALRVVPAEQQEEVLERALEMGLSARYGSPNELAARILQDLVAEKAGPAERLRSSRRFEENVPAAERDHVLDAIDYVLAHGGIVEGSALAAAVGEHEFRIDGYVARLGEYLNVDGYRVVTFDPVGREVRIDGEKLFQLFEVSR